MRAPSTCGALLSALGSIVPAQSATLVPGEALVAELGCTSCHSAPEPTLRRLRPPGAPLLDAAGARITPQYLRAFLSDPQGTKPGTRMPDLLSRYSHPEHAERVEDLVHFLASRGGPPGESEAHALSLDELERGRVLFHEIGCVACHLPEEQPRQLEVPLAGADPWEGSLDGDDQEELWMPEGVLEPSEVSLGDLARKTTVEALAAFLADPHRVRPSGRMPSLRLTAEEARAIAMYLLREQAFGETSEPADAMGLGYRYYEGSWEELPDFEGLEVVREGTITDFGTLPPHRGDRFAFRYQGWIEFPEAGDYTFTTRSDDGSRLWIDGQLVVDNDGIHGAVEVAGTVSVQAGRLPIEVAMFELEGDSVLEVMWERPGAPRELLPPDVLAHRSHRFVPLEAAPFEVDPDRARAGARLYRSLGCAACHEPELDASPGAPAFFDLDGQGARGCLSETPSGNLPRYELGREERESLGALVNDTRPLAHALTFAAALDRDLRANRCLTCHRRQGVGGPHPRRLPYFTVYEDVDLGEQGRVPPQLDVTGAKLRRSWLEDVLLNGATWRPYMATRMPQFGRGNVGHMVELFTRADGVGDPEVEPAFDEETLENGRRLVGTKGLGCIQCHDFAGYDSLGVPAVDIAYAYDRLRAGWFEELLLDPGAIDMNTRMPEFWFDGRSPVADLYDGDPGAQIDAIWAYLSLGSSMPLPQGLLVPDAEFELTPTDVPLLVGVFMEHVSPRTVAVGFPERMHYAFDVESSRLAMAWRGRFFNARGTWEGRAGGLESPPSADRLDLEAVMPFHLAPEPSAAWPEPLGAEAGYRSLGRRFDAQRVPSFRYAYAGIEIEERPVPIVRVGGTWIARRFELRSDEPVRDLVFLVLRGTEVAADDERTFSNAAGHRVRVLEPAGVEPDLVRAREGHELRLSVPFEPVDGGWMATLEVEFTW